MAWWLAYEELYGDMDKEYPIMSKDDVTILGGDSESDTITFTANGVGAADTISIDNSWWADDGYSVTGNPFGAGEDTITFGEITGSRLKGGMGEDHISFNINPGLAGTQWDDPKYYANGIDFGDAVRDPVGPVPAIPSYKNVKPVPDLSSEQTQKYGEDKGIADLKDYVCSTYQGHYTSRNNNVQTLDLIQSVGDAESFCRSNAIKYLSRYDKKGQAKRDILKAMHYCLLLYYFSGQTNETPTRGYETF